jgi:two-component system, cell cycle sensor histidine kinase and response regulator CckA
MPVRDKPLSSASSEFLAALLDSLLDAVVTIDARGRINGYNQVAERLFGHPGGEILGQDVGILIPFPYRREHDAQFSRYLATGQTSILGSAQQVEGRRRDGSTFPCELAITEFSVDGERFFAGVVRQLGEREQTLVARGETRLRNIIDSLMALVGVYSTDGILLDVNQAALDAAGIARADALGQRIDRTPWISHSPPTAAKALAMIRRAAAGETVRDELDLQTGNGECAYVDVIMNPLRDASGQITEVLTSAIDITERRSAEREVQRRLRQQEAVARLGVLAVKTRDLPMLLTTAVEIAHEVLGVDACTVAVEIDPHSPRPPPAGDGASATSLNAAIEGRHGPYGVLAADACPPHTFRKDEETFLQSVANVLADVVRHTQTESQLQQEREFSATLFESLPGLVALIDEHSRLVRWNGALERLTGYDSAEIARVHALDLVAADERSLFTGKIRDVFELGHATSEGHVRSRDGRLTPMLFSALRITVRDRPHLLAVGLDISDRRRLEEQLRHSQKMEALGRLAGGVAHDFNNLLTVISGFAGLLLADLAPDDPNRGNVTEITQAADSAASLTRQLLAFSRRTMLEPVVVDLNAAVDDMETMLRRLIGEDVQLSTALAPGLRHIRGDIGLISQVLMNLAVNARDAMPLGGTLTIATRNVDLDEAYARTHAGAVAGPCASLVVTDTGSGMSPDVRARAFEPFFTTKGVGRGSGLGLAVVHGIAEQIGARIELESEVGAGTTFTILFPAVDEPLPVRAPADPEALEGAGTVLLVEDEEGVRRLARLILERQGYCVLEADSGEDAIRLLERHTGPLDLVVTDVVMPGIDGRDVADATKARFPQAKVLYLSGYTSDAVVRRGILHHEVAFLQKPFSPTSLAAKVRDVLRQPEA